MRSPRGREAIAIAVIAASTACAGSHGGGPDPAIARYEVRDTAEYAGTIYGGRLGVLYWKGARVDSIDLGFGVQAVPGGILYLPVRGEHDPDLGDLVYFTEHVLYDGRSKRALSEQLPRFVPHFSSPSVIDSLLYYWGLERDTAYDYRTYAMRYDFIAERAESIFLFQAPLATDNPFHFSPPSGEDGRVRFETYGRVFRVDREPFRLVGDEES